ncbi:response regulator [Desulfococcaceae bacterium HSG7]|nr:response regulator [Desulfococcaceae bacterium HSG7]
MKNPAHILLVEDNRMDVELILDAFEEGHLENKVNVVHDGQQALDYLFGEREYADRLKYPIPNLILLDLKMPGIGGHQVLRRIKKEKTLKRIPVIILTSSKEEGDRALSYDCGANSYLVKPISFEGFIKIIRQIEEYWIMLNVGPPDD